MVRPLFREALRTLLTILAIALGVAVVLAIDLASDAATGSFRSSMETLAGENELEVVTSGGVPEYVVGTLATLAYSIRVSPRIEDYAVIPRVLGHATGLSPLVVLFSVSAVGFLFGGFYVLLAIPIAAVVATLVDVIMRDVDPAEQDVPAVLFAGVKEES